MSVLTERRTAPVAAPPAPPRATAHRPAARPAAPATARPKVRRAHPWWAALAGLVVGFLVGLLPASFVTEVFATQLPLGTSVVEGRTAMVISGVLASLVGLAFAVFAAARAVHRQS